MDTVLFIATFLAVAFICWVTKEDVTDYYD